MKELTVFEMEAVSGAGTENYSWDFSSFGSLVLSTFNNALSATAGALGGAVAGGFIGSIIGGRWGGEGGGILGIGSIGQGVGMLYGAAFGMAGGAVAGALGGWDDVYEFGIKALDGLVAGTLKLW
jgi:energy-coupling factor transport system substrate-specific component